MRNKWDNIKIEQLKELLKTKSAKETAEIIGFTEKAVKVKATRLKISIIQFKWETINCQECGKEKRVRKNENSKFCSKSCSASNMNKFRTIESRNKQKNSLLKTLSLKFTKKKPKKQRQFILKNGKLIRKINPPKVRNCKSCNKEIFNTFKSFCEQCKYKYYKLYRVACNFTFLIKDYNYLFSFDEIANLKRYGMYSPINKNNNLKGVSRDHIFSVNEAYKLNIKPSFINHPANCRLLKHEENNKKKTRCDLTLNELYNNIIKSEKIKRYLNDEDLDLLTSLVESANRSAKSME